jgi:hypothetical protein
MIVILGLVLVGIGLMSIFAKDIMWEFTHLSNQAKGIASERTEWWDTTSTIGGVFAVIVGIVTVVIGFTS